MGSHLESTQSRHHDVQKQQVELVGMICEEIDGLWAVRCGEHACLGV
jgi:hypothetical protein